MSRTKAIHPKIKYNIYSFSVILRANSDRCMI